MTSSASCGKKHRLTPVRVQKVHSEGSESYRLA
jgi:hypothetical protein